MTPYTDLTPDQRRALLTAPLPSVQHHEGHTWCGSRHVNRARTSEAIKERTPKIPVSEWPLLHGEPEWPGWRPFDGD